MTNTEKSNIIMEVTEVVNRRNKIWNSKQDVANIYNAWSRTSKYKYRIKDMEFLSWLLFYIEDIITIDKDLLNEVVEIEKQDKY